MASSDGGSVVAGNGVARSGTDVESSVSTVVCCGADCVVGEADVGTLATESVASPLGVAIDVPDG